MRVRALPASAHLLVLALTALVAVGCRGSGTGEPFLSAADGGPVSALPPCEAPPLPEGSVEPDLLRGVELPPGSVITKAKRKKPVTNFGGYLAMTPVQARQYYQGRGDLEILLIEDEITESEMLVSNGGHRTFAKFRSVCDRGSSLVGVVAPEIQNDEEARPE